MSVVLGVELNGVQVHAVTIDSWRSLPRKTAALPWDPERPDALVSALRDDVEGFFRMGMPVTFAIVGL